jgi:hypothetical protein
MKHTPFLRGCSALAVTLAFAAPVAAQQVGQDNTGFGTSSGEFLLLGASARGAALGGAFAALSKDVAALYYNPAGLAEMPRPGAMVSTYSYVAGTRYTWAGIGFPLAGGARAIGVSLGTFGFSNQPVYTLDNPDGTGETYSVAETFIAGTYAQNFSDRFSAGFTAKLISDALGRTKASAFALDFGTNFHAMIGQRPIRAAFVIQNLGTNLAHTGSGLDQGITRAPPLGTVNIPQEPQPVSLKSSSWSLPVLFRIGVAFDLLTLGQSRVTALSEFTQPNNNKPGAGGGLEYTLSNIAHSGFSVSGRASYTIQPANQLNPNDPAVAPDPGFATHYSTGSFTQYGIAAGGGVEYNRGTFRLGFDYAYRELGPLGGTNYLSFGLSW